MPQLCTLYNNLAQSITHVWPQVPYVASPTTGVSKWKWRALLRGSKSGQKCVHTLFKAPTQYSCWCVLLSQPALQGQLLIHSLSFWPSLTKGLKANLILDHVSASLTTIRSYRNVLIGTYWNILEHNYRKG